MLERYERLRISRAFCRAFFPKGVETDRMSGSEGVPLVNLFAGGEKDVELDRITKN
jgi:hypothetical protein